jgi:CheY-like chemotaxis protein
MELSGVILIIEDDPDDHEIFEALVRELGINNDIKWFLNAQAGFDYLKNTNEKTFIIFSDVNMPGLNGIEFKRQIDADPELRKKSIPFVFLTTYASQDAVNEAFTKMTVQGFFKKESNYVQMKTVLKAIFDYWIYSKHPNAF